MTFSLLARSADGSEVGLAVQSKFPGVASNSLFGRAGVGVVVTQGFSNPSHAQQALDLLSLGTTPSEAIQIIRREDLVQEQRQMAILTSNGAMASSCGTELSELPGEAAMLHGSDCLAIGNLLTTKRVLSEMVRSFEEHAREQGQDLAAGLIAGLRAGQAAGGEVRGMQAAGLRIFEAHAGFQGHGETKVDVSVYDHESPIEELARCYRLHQLSYLPSDPDNLVNIVPEHVNFIGSLLVGEGFLDMLPTASSWGVLENQAVAKLLGFRNYDGRIRSDGLIDSEILEDLKGQAQPTP